MVQINLSGMLMETSFGMSPNRETLTSKSSFESFNTALVQAKGNQKPKDTVKNSGKSNQPSYKDDYYKQSTESEGRKELTQTGKDEIRENSCGESQKAEEDKTKLTDDTNEEVLTNEVMTLISQMFNIPVEDIKCALEELNAGIESIMTEEGFGQFISQVLGEDQINSLLIGDAELNSISELFDKLSILQQGEEENTADVRPFDLSSQAQESYGEITETVQEINFGNIETGENNGISKYDNDGSTHLDGINGNTVQTQDMGNILPVHNFTTTVLAQNFTSGTESVLQTISAKISESGEIFVEQIDFKVLGETKELNVHLSPKELGDLNIRIVEHNGAVVAEIKVDNEKTKEMIQSQLHLLKENIEEQGINISEVKVDIRQDDSRSQMEQEKQKSSKRIQEIISKHFSEELEIEEEIAPELSDSEVDYMV